MDFYTYMWLRKDATPYYVGKGSNGRAWAQAGHCVRKPVDRARVFVQYWASEAEAFEMEKYYIRLFGRKNNGTGILRNLTDGGDGNSGKIISEEQRREHSRFMTGKPAWNKGMKLSEEHRDSLRKAKRGNRNAKGHRLSDEVRSVVVANLRRDGSLWLGRKHSDESIQRMQSANKGLGLGRTLSETTKQRIREARLRYWKEKSQCRI